MVNEAPNEKERASFIICKLLDNNDAYMQLTKNNVNKQR